LGKIESIEGSLVHMQAPDGSKVQVQTGNSTYDTPYAEIQGTVLDPMTIREESHVNFGDNFGEPPGSLSNLYKPGTAAGAACACYDLHHAVLVTSALNLCLCNVQ